VLSVINIKGNVVAQSSVKASGDFILSNIPPSDANTIRLSGSDTSGNLILSQLVNDVNVTSASVTKITTPFVVALADPNPPVISTIKFDENISVDSYDRLIINPSLYEYDSQGNKRLLKGNYISFEVIASDKDGDKMTYDYKVDGGVITAKKGNQIQWLAPEDGQNVTITFIVKSNNRTAQVSKTIRVNHAPQITLQTPTIEQLQNDANILTKTSLDIFSLGITAYDFEDGDLSAKSIKWYSNLQGYLGKGLNLQTTLRPGLHKISVVATDEQNLSTRKNYFVKATTPHEVILKVSGKDIDYEDTPLADSYKLNILADGLTLQYSSNNPQVATVDSNGSISAVASGAAKITVISVEKNDQNQSVYKTDLVVRVVDSVDASQEHNMSINQIYQLEVNANTLKTPLHFPNLKRGTYVVVLFDKVNIVKDSSYRSKITKNGADVTPSKNSATTYIIHKFKVSNAGDSYDLYLEPTASNYDMLLKVALYPGSDVHDAQGYINKSYWNQSYEPNDDASIASAQLLQNMISEKVMKDDSIDYYKFSLLKDKVYTLEVYSSKLNPQYGHLQIEMSDLDVNTLIKPTNIAPGSEKSYEFTASSDGDALLALYSSDSSYYDRTFNYKVRLLPSSSNGLKHDSVTYEPNNTPSTASKGPNLQEFLTSELSADLIDSADYFTMDLVKDQNYTLEVYTDSNNPQYSGMDISILDSNGNAILAKQSLTRDTQKSYQFTSTVSGKVYVKITGDSSYYYKYTFRLLSDLLPPNK